MICKACRKEMHGRIRKYCSAECRERFKRIMCLCYSCGVVNSVRTYSVNKCGEVYICRVCALREMYRNREKSIVTSGYATVVVVGADGSRKQVRQHRHNMEEYLNRKLATEEHVHHIDFIKLNNDISNLVVLSMSEHRYAERSIYLLVSTLLKKGFIRFNRDTKVYEVPEGPSDNLL